jgi:plastocyanin
LLVIPLLIGPRAFGEDVITIYNGAGTRANDHFVDVQVYPVEAGHPVTWHNDDYVKHELVISSDEGLVLANSGPIALRGSFSYTFNETGLFEYRSALYPEVAGRVLVSDEMVVMNSEDVVPGLDMQISWTPASPSIGEETHIKNIFIDNKSQRNQEHVDYSLTLTDSAGNAVELRSDSHALNGLQVTSHIFDKRDDFTLDVKVHTVFFVPATSSDATFPLRTTPEFSGFSIALLASLGGVVFASSFLKRRAVDKLSRPSG